MSFTVRTENDKIFTEVFLRLKCTISGQSAGNLVWTSADFFAFVQFFPHLHISGACGKVVNAM
jgi:hypothetical protein